MTVEHELIFQGIFQKRKRNKKGLKSAKTNDSSGYNLGYKRIRVEDTTEPNKQVLGGSTQTIEDILWECLKTESE